MAGSAPKLQRESHNRNLAPPLLELHNSPPVQTKLEIGKPGDKYEQEADQMADQVMMAPYDRSNMVMMAPNPGNPTLRMMPMPKRNMVMMAGNPDNPTIRMKPRLQKNQIAGYKEEEEKAQMQAELEEEKVQLMEYGEEEEMIQPEMHQEEEEMVQTKCAECEEKEKPQKEPAIQKAEDGTTHASPDLTASINFTKGQGRSLPKSTKQEMGNKMGADFSEVKVHNNSQAAEMSNSIGAKAFTHGSDIYFNKGEYNPNSQSGKHLLAHELTHTVQQGASQNKKIQPKIDPTSLNYSDLAKQIYKAIKGLGTDEDAVYAALKKLDRNRDAIKILKATYQKQYNVSLVSDIKGDFSGEELLDALQLLVPLKVDPTSLNYSDLAKQIYKAIKGLGTDEDAIYAALQNLNRNRDAIKILKATYQKLYNVSLDSDIKGDFSGSELLHALQLLVPSVAKVPKKTVTINITHLHGSSGNAASAISDSNSVVYKQADVKLKKGTEVTLNEKDTKKVIGNDLILDEYPAPDRPTDEEKALFKLNQTKGAVTMYFVKAQSMDNSGEAFWPALGHGFVGFVNANIANSRSFAHELGHVLLDDGGHNVPDETYLMWGSKSSTKYKLSTKEIAKIRSSPYAT